MEGLAASLRLPQYVVNASLLSNTGISGGAQRPPLNTGAMHCIGACISHGVSWLVPLPQRGAMGFPDSLWRDHEKPNPTCFEFLRYL
jgi:hypothetical protein